MSIITFANVFFLSFFIPNRALIQNLDFSNSSVCGEAAGESLSALSHSARILSQNKNLYSNHMNITWLSGVQKPEGGFIFCVRVKSSCVWSREPAHCSLREKTFVEGSQMARANVR